MFTVSVASPPFPSSAVTVSAMVPGLVSAVHTVDAARVSASVPAAVFH